MDQLSLSFSKLNIDETRFKLFNNYSSYTLQKYEKITEVVTDEKKTHKKKNDRIKESELNKVIRPMTQDKYTIITIDHFMIIYKGNDYYSCYPLDYIDITYSSQIKGSSHNLIMNIIYQYPYELFDRNESCVRKKELNEVLYIKI